MTDILLKVRDLKTYFDTQQGTLHAVDGLSFDIRRGETFALLGESGCGKSMTAMSLMRLVPAPAGQITFFVQPPFVDGWRLLEPLWLSPLRGLSAGSTRNPVSSRAT